MNGRKFTTALFAVKEGLELLDELRRHTDDSKLKEVLEHLVSSNIGILEDSLEDTEGVINHFIFETNFGETALQSPWEDTSGTKWYLKHPIDVYDYLF